METERVDTNERAAAENSKISTGQETMFVFIDVVCLGRAQ